MTEDRTSIQAFLSAVAGTLAAIIGIVVAVSLVALELLRPTYAGHAFRELFTRTSLRNLILLYLATIAIALFTLTRLEVYQTGVVAALSNYVGILTLLSLIVLYPSLRITLKASSPDRHRLKDLAEEISLMKLLEVHRSLRLPFIDQLDRLEDHPLFVLRTVASRSIREGDRKTAGAVISLVREGFLKAIRQLDPEKATPEHRDFIRALLFFLRPIGAEALDQRDEASLQMLASVYDRLQAMSASRGLPWHQLIELNRWFGDLAARGAAVGLDSFSSAVEWSIREALAAHLEKNVPDEKEIWSLQPWEEVADEDVDHEKTNHWDNIRDEYLRMLNNLVKSAIIGGHIEIVSSSLRGFRGVIERVASTHNLGQKQKADLIHWANFYLHTTTLEAVEAFGSLPGGILTAFSPLQISDALENDEPWAKNSLLNLCRVQLTLARREIASPPSLNMLGTIGRGCIHHIEEDDRFAEATILVARTLEELGETFSSSNSLESTRLIREVEEQLQSLERWFESSGVAHEFVEAEIHRLIKRAVERVTEYGSADAVLDWPSLTNGEWQNCE